MFWQGPLGNGATHPVPVTSLAVSVMKSLRRGPKGSPLGSSKMSERVPTGIGLPLLSGFNWPVIRARSKLNVTTEPVSVPVETTGFPSVRSLIETTVDALAPALALRTTATGTSTTNTIKVALDNSLCVICPSPGVAFLSLSDLKVLRSPIAEQRPPNLAERLVAVAADRVLTSAAGAWASTRRGALAVLVDPDGWHGGKLSAVALLRR